VREANATIADRPRQPLRRCSEVPPRRPAEVSPEVPLTASPTAPSVEAAKPRRPGLTDVFRGLRRPKIAVMLALGFSSGLPFMLVGGTFGYWLRDEGVTLKVIAFTSWVGFAYAFKYLWAPLVDRLPIPVLGAWLGRRRAWMLLAQALVVVGLVAMAMLGTQPGIYTTQRGIYTLCAAGLVVAFSSATQDIVVDAWRIESADSGEELGLLTSAYQLGYRVAMLTSDALILLVASRIDWSGAYLCMAALMIVGVSAAAMAGEPLRADAVLDAKETLRPLWTPLGFFDAVVGPFIAFFRANAWVGLVMLLFISLYRLPEYVMGPMATPYYVDLGFSKDLVGVVRGTLGLCGSLGGIAFGGFLVARLGSMKGLIVGGVLQGLVIAGFALPAILGPDPRLFGVVMFCDNFGVSVAGVALITYMSGLTSLGYTATQYALLSSTYALFGKFLKGFSGKVVEWLGAQGHSLMDSYAIFFVGSAAMGIPAILLCIWLAYLTREQVAPSVRAS
jgi:PAT family beta-lactamase induction signal transducer AmpG